MKPDLSKLKTSVLLQLKQELEVRKDALNQALNAAKESRDNETKSSVGDKYETGRAMAQAEVDKIKTQIQQTANLKTQLSTIDPDKQFEKVGVGSLVKTDQKTYFISIGIGRIEIEKEEIYCISMASPIGQLLQHKQLGEIFSFRGNEIKICGIS